MLCLKSADGLWILQLRKAHFVTFGVSAMLLFLYMSFHVLYDDQTQFLSVPSVPTPSDARPSSKTSLYDSTKVAFMVETRPLPHLSALFTHMTALVPSEWTFRFMGSVESIQQLMSSSHIARLETIGKLSVLEVPSQYNVTSRETISQMFTDIHLYRDILSPAENLLVFQPDSILCANSKETLNDWLEWDWVGAPWSASAQFGGNGGLSLRKVSRVLKVLEAQDRPVDDPALEDLWLTTQLVELEDAKMPDANISKHFSVESIWDDCPLGYHVGWLGVHHGQIWDDEQQVRHIIEYCPEVKLILGMKLDNDKPVGVPR